MRWLILAGLWLCYASFGVTVASLAPLVPVIQADLQMSQSAMGSVMGAWQLVYIVAAIPCGMLLDRLGGRWARARRRVRTGTPHDALPPRRAPRRERSCRAPSPPHRAAA